MQKCRLAIFGTGQGALQTLEHLDPAKVDIVCFIDSNKEKQGLLFQDRPVVSPEEVPGMEVDYFLIGSVSYYHEMKRILRQAGVPEHQIFSLLMEARQKQDKSFRHMNRQITRSNNCYIKIVKDEYLHLYFRNYAVCQMYLDFDTRTKGLYPYGDYLLHGIDYVRVSTVELLAREIRDNRIEGAIGELGVYRGHFSRVLRSLFPDRDLYLFDTFEGFHPNDVRIDREASFSSSRAGHLSDTTIDLVLDKLNHDPNAHIIKGFFPESVKQTEDRPYAFVSIDVDLYQPTYEGLNYFYNLLSKGGYIMVHDFNHDYYKGSKEAVKKFCREMGIGYVPVSDYYGSVLIAK